MSNANYNKGAALERRAKKLLEAHGYLVIRSAGSHGAFDLCALACRADGAPVPRLIQIKANRPGPLKKLRRLRRKLRVSASIEVWLYKRGVAAPEIVEVF